MKRIIFIANLLFSIVGFAQPGSIDLTFNPGISAYGILTTAVQSDGKIIIAGNFTSYNGIAIKRIARLNANGTLDTTFNPGIGPVGISSSVDKISIQSDGKIIIAGGFTSYNGIAINHIARLNANGTLDTTFNPRASVNRVPATLAIQSDGKIIIGGSFTSYNGIARNGIARLNTDGTLDTDFNPGTGISFSQYYIYYVKTISFQSDGKIIVGGDFASYNGIAINNIARLNTDGTLDTTFNPGSLGARSVYITSVQSDGKIIIARVNSSYQGLTYYGFTRLNTNGTLDSTFKPAIGLGLEDSVSSFSIQGDGKIIVMGYSFLYSPWNRNTFARLNNDGSLDTTFNPGTGADNNINSISIQSDGKIIIMGDFTSYNGIGRNYIARINGDNTLNNFSFNKSSIAIFPNPSNGIYILKNNEINAKKTICIYTLLGQKIYDADILTNETFIDISNQPKGVYLYKVFGEEGETKCGKLVIE